MAYNSTHTGAQIDSVVTDILDLQEHVNIDTLYQVTAGITAAGVNFAGLPGFSLDSEIKLTASRSGANGAPILYFGRNFCDITHITYQDDILNMLNVCATQLGPTESADERYFYPNNEGSFSSAATRSAIKTANNFRPISDGTNTVKHNHQYLFVMEVAVAAERTGDAFAIASVNITDSSNSTVLGTATPQKFGETNYYYAFITPTWSWSASADSKAAWLDFVIAGNAITSGDLLKGAFLVDLSQYADDLTTGRNTTQQTALLTRYTGNYTTLAQGTTPYVKSTKLHGQYYGSTLTKFFPYQRKWFVRCPAGYCIYIRQYTTTSNGKASGTAVGYIKTQMIGGSSAVNKSFMLDNSVTLGLPVIDFYYGTASDDSAPAAVTASTNNSTYAPHVQYVPTEYWSLSDSQLASKYPWVIRRPGICLYSSLISGIDNGNSGTYPNAMFYGPLWDSNGFDNTATNCQIWAANGSMPSSGSTVKVTLRKILQDLFSMTDQQINTEDAVGASSIALQYTGDTNPWNVVTDVTILTGAKFNYTLDSTGGVGSSLVSLQGSINNLEANPVISTLPTAEGTYKYEVPSGGGLGTWTKEEETVKKSYFDNYNLGLLQKQFHELYPEVPYNKIGYADLGWYAWNYIDSWEYPGFRMQWDQYLPDYNGSLKLICTKYIPTATHADGTWAGIVAIKDKIIGGLVGYQFLVLRDDEYNGNYPDFSKSIKGIWVAYEKV